MSQARAAAGAAATAAALLLAACGAEGGCEPPVSAPGTCHDLSFRGREYDEWREVEPAPILQEVGNATYPDCNAAEGCDAADLDGFAATDVWLVNGVEVADAVVGLREGTHTYVMFVRVGVDPALL